MPHTITASAVAKRPAIGDHARPGRHRARQGWHPRPQLSHLDAGPPGTLAYNITTALNPEAKIIPPAHSAAGKAFSLLGVEENAVSGRPGVDFRNISDCGY